MPAESSEMWSEYSSTKNSAQRGWQVTGALDDNEARLATPLSGTNPIPAVNDTHPENSLLRVRDLAVSSDGPNLRIVRAIYQLPSGGGFIPPELIGIIKLVPEQGSTSEPYDKDTKNFAVLNAGGFPFASDQTRELPDLSFTLISRELVYPWGKAVLASEGAVNDAPISIPLGPSVTKGQMLVMPPRMVDGIVPNGGIVEVHYPIRVRKDGWRTRIRHEGYMGWYQPTGGGGPAVGNFVDANEDPPSQPVLLDFVGKPINPTFKIKTHAGFIVAPIPAPSRTYPDTGYWEPANANGTPIAGAECYFMRFHKWPELNLANFFPTLT